MSGSTELSLMKDFSWICFHNKLDMNPIGFYPIYKHMFNMLGGIKLELAKYYKDSEMTAFISEKSRNSK